MTSKRNGEPQSRSGGAAPKGQMRAARLPASLRKLRFDLQKGLTAPELVQAAVERVKEHLFANVVETFKYDPNPLLGLSHDEMERRLRRLIGTHSLTIFHDRVVIVKHNAAVQLEAAKEILGRFYPTLNRSDPNQKREWRVVREDPNVPGGEQVVRIQEIPTEARPRAGGQDEETL